MVGGGGAGSRQIAGEESDLIISCSSPKI